MAPMVVEYVPGLHSEQLLIDVAAKDAEYVPGLHRVQLLSATAPMSVEKVP